MSYKNLWLGALIMVAISVGCSQAAWDCYGTRYSERISLEELKDILNGPEPSAELIARSLAETKDKDQVVFGDKITVSDLLEFGYLPYQKWDCDLPIMKSLEERIEQVSENRYLQEYCKQGFESRKRACLGEGDRLYDYFIRNYLWRNRRKFKLALIDIRARFPGWSVESRKELTEGELVNHYESLPMSRETRKRMVEWCTEYNRMMKEKLYYFDPNAEWTFKYLAKYKNNHSEIFMHDICAAIGK